MRIRVVGLGTSFGDDAAGPLVATALANGPPLPPDVDVVTCYRPVDLVELLDGVDAAVVVDAARFGARPGTVHEVAPGRVAESARTSSHGLGLREALALAEALDRAPRRISVVAIEARGEDSRSLSPEVESAVDEAAAVVRARCRAWRTGAAPASTETSTHA